MEDVLMEQLRREAKAQATSVSGLVQSLVEEGLRMRALPDIVFRPGPSGRRPGVVGGPDVWEVIVALKGSEKRGEAAVGEVAAELSLEPRQVAAALDYYGRWPREIDEWIAENDRLADEAQAAWEARQLVLA